MAPSVWTEPAATEQLVSLGSNLGDAARAIATAEQAIERLAKPGTLRCSSQHATTPVGGPAGQGPFLNSVVAFRCELAPEELLRELQAIEASLDRNRDARWGARTLDADLLLCGDRIVTTPSLRVPHPRMTFRPFVLAPAVEVAADWAHPECGHTLGELHELLSTGRNEVALLNDEGGVVADWIAAAAPGLRVGAGAARDGFARLMIDAGGASPTPGHCGPRLALADCPREYWRDEVLAALECVWPSPSS